MKETMGETSMTVVTIIILAALAVIVSTVIGSDEVKDWITDIFTNNADVPEITG